MQIIENFEKGNFRHKKYDHDHISVQKLSSFLISCMLASLGSLAKECMGTVHFDLRMRLWSIDQRK